MTDSDQLGASHIDSYVWGRERILWGYDPQHRYTLKILEPEVGEQGCLSLQYHDQKSESWVVLGGTAWALVVIDGVVCTRVMQPGAVQNLPAGTIHRLMGLSSDVQVLESSTPDRHAADKSVSKDVVRLHCYLGREVSAPRDSAEQLLVDSCVLASDRALKALEAGVEPEPENSELVEGSGLCHMI